MRTLGATMENERACVIGRFHVRQFNTRATVVAGFPLPRVTVGYIDISNVDKRWVYLHRACMDDHCDVRGRAAAVMLLFLPRAAVAVYGQVALGA